MNFKAVFLEFSADFFLELFSEGNVVELGLRGRIVFEEFGYDHRGGKVIGNQTSDQIPFQNIVLQLLDRQAFHFLRRDFTRDHVSCRNAVFSDFQNSRVRRPQACDCPAINARKIENRLRYVIERIEERLVPNIAFGIADDDNDAVGTEQTVLIFKERVDVRVIGGQALVEACIHSKFACFISEDDGDEHDKRQHGHSATEENRFKKPDHRTRLLPTRGQR